MSRDKRRYILVTRQTRLEELVQRFNTWPQAKFYLEHNDTDPKDYVEEHDTYKREVLAVETAMQGLGRFQLLERAFLPSYQFGADDVIVVVGQDGLVANTLKYLTGQPVIGVNPDPDRWSGVLLPFVSGDLKVVLKGLAADRVRLEEVTFAEARTNDGQVLRAVNDLFIGPKSHTSARYVMRLGEFAEEQSSSGIIVSTGFGSTGWLQSILAGARGVYRDAHAGGAPEAAHGLTGGFPWDEDRLQFAVREPFPSPTTGTRLVFGQIDARDRTRDKLVIESRIPERGVIFSDGMEGDFLSFNAGTVATVGVAAEKGRLVVG